MALLELEDIGKSFGGIVALNDVTFSVNTKGIIGLIGPNGSGKTTLFNIITGMYPDYEGKITFENKVVDRTSKPYEIKYLGIARTFQNIRLFPNMTVLENVAVGMHCLVRTNLLQAVARTRVVQNNDRWMRDQSFRALEFFGPRLTDNTNKPAFSLSYANRRRLEIARAMVANPKLLLLDEPTAGMNPKESEDMAEKIRTMKEKGMTVIVIEHDMNVIMGVSEKIIVLDHGIRIAEGTPEEIRNDQRVLDAYLGEGLK
jgi:ABC-type branched-subunit amino acid transport system ATPase component